MITPLSCSERESQSNLNLFHARDGHWQRKWITIFSASADLHPRQKSLGGNYSCSVFPVSMPRSNPSSANGCNVLYSKDKCIVNFFGNVVKYFNTNHEHSISKTFVRLLGRTTKKGKTKHTTSSKNSITFVWSCIACEENRRGLKIFALQI